MASTLALTCSACAERFQVPWAAVFRNDRRVEVEIGPGRGEVLLAFAARAPETNFFAIERTCGRAEALMSRVRAHRLDNVRVVAGDAALVARLIPDRSVGAYHIYFPDPWPKSGHRRRRLARGGLPAELVRTLVPGGALHVATDLPDLLAELSGRLLQAGLVHAPGVPPPLRPTTSFERRYARAGTHYACFVRPRKSETAGAPEP
jgi:tRNA (guanine-N7-)-methyltransferase